MKLLVRTPSPYPTESLFGFALRVSEQNGYPTPWHLLTYAGISPGQSRTAGIPGSKLAGILGKLPETLDAISYCKREVDGKLRFKLLGHSLGAGLSSRPLRLNQPAFCPECVKSDGYLDAFWDLKLAVACPIHRVTLLLHCPYCSNVLNRFRPGILECKCGAKLDSSSLPKEGAALCELMSILRCVLHRTNINSDSFTEGLPIRELVAIPLSSLLRGLSVLGTYALTVIGSSADARNPLELMRKNAEILSDWPKKFHEFLNQIGPPLDPDIPSGVGLRAQFEGFCSAMFKGKWSKDFEFLRNEFIYFGQFVWGRAVVDKRMLRRTSGNQTTSARFTTLSEFARTKGVRPITLKRWSEQGLLELNDVQVGQQKRFIVDATKVLVSSHLPGQILGERQAAAYINFPVSVLHALRKSGNYQVRHMPEHKPQYHQKDLDIFLERIFEKVGFSTLPVNETDNPISLGRIFLQGKSLAIAGKAAFVASYLDGSIQAIGRNGASSHDILFARRDVESHFKAARLVAAKGSLTAAQSAALIDCDPMAIKPLTTEGFLVERKRLNRFAICEKSVRRFSCRYVSLSSLANQLKTTATTLLRVCALHSIPLLKIARSIEATVAFVTRAESTKLIELIIEKKKKKTRPLSCISRVETYLADLDACGGTVPLIGTRVNKSMIAEACHVDRKTLSTNMAALQLIEAFKSKPKPVAAGLR